MVERVAEEVFIPFTVGGGIRTLEDARRMLRAGADKVSVNTAAVQRPDLIADIATEFGAQWNRAGGAIRAPEPSDDREETITSWREWCRTMQGDPAAH